METDKIQFGFKSGCGITNVIFILRQLYEKYLAKKKEFILCIRRFGESFTISLLRKREL